MGRQRRAGDRQLPLSPLSVSEASPRGPILPVAGPVHSVAPALPRALAGGALLALVAGGLFFQGLGRYPLLDPDEARHAEVAREMASGQGVRRFFLPTLELEPYREKPAPFYWLVALAYRLAGVEAGPARGVSALAALATVLAVYAYAVPRTGIAGALGAGLVLATSAGWFALARYVNLDMTLTACVTAGVLAGLAWLDRIPPRRPPLAPYVAAALGTLVKGPLGAALVAGPLGLAIACHCPRPSLRELGLVRGIALAGALVALLWIPVGLLDASYVLHFARTNVHRLGFRGPHAAPVYYYLVWLPVLVLPWTLLAPAPVRRAARDPGRRALVLWAAFVPALLTLARGKLATYALSALVPLALIVGPDLARALRGGPPAEDSLALRVGGGLAAAALAGGALATVLIRRLYPVSALGSAVLATAALAWAGALGLTLRSDRPGLLPAVVLGGALTLYPLGTEFVGPAIGALHSDQEAARLIAGAGPAPVIAFGARAPSLVFYLGTPVIHTENLGRVENLFAGEATVFLVTGRRHFEEVERRLGVRAHRWQGTARRRLYANRPPPDRYDPNGSR